VSKAGSNTSPYDTWAKAATHINGLSIAAGDTVLIGQGVYLNTRIPLASGSLASNKTYYLDSAYVANGSDEFGLAQLNGADTIPKANWAVYSGSGGTAVYRALWTTFSNCDNWSGYGWERTWTVTQDGQLFEPVDAIASVNAEGRMTHDTTTNYIYIRPFGGVNPNTTEIQASCKTPCSFTDEAEQNLVFGGLDIRMGKQGVIRMEPDGGAPDSNLFRYCKITRNAHYETNNPATIFFDGGGTEGGFDSSGAWDANYARFWSFDNCSIGVSSAVQGGTIAHNGSGCIIYNGSNIDFDSCHFYDCNGDGIEIKNSYSNIADDGIGAQITVRYSTFRDILGGGFNIYSMGHRDSAYGNIFVNCDNAGIIIGDGQPYLADQGDHFLCNNTFYQCNEGLQVQPDNENNPVSYPDFTGQFKYNIIYDIVTGVYQPAPYDFRDPITGINIDIDSNQIYEPSNSPVFWSYWGGTSRTWSYWTATAGNDVNSANTSPGLNTTTFEPSSTISMSQTYGGRTWTRYGAIQPDAACPDTLVAPVFESPANGATGQQNSVILDWSDSTQVGTVTAYDLQVDNNSDYSSVTFSSSPTDSRDTVTTALTHLTTYYWRVRSRTACDTSAWSASRTFVVDAYVWPMPSRRANPLNSWLDSTSTLDDQSIYLCGMDDVAGTDADTLVARGKWKVVIWSGNPEDAVKVKSRDSTVKLILYSSLDHGLKSNDLAIDTSDGGNTWNTTADEYSHYKKVANDSSKHYYSLFYQFHEDTKILLFPSVRSGYMRFDTVFFKGATLPISDDDSSSIVPDVYSSPYHSTYITRVLVDADTIEGGATDTIKARWNYIGTQVGSTVTRVYPDMSNPLTRYAERTYSTRMFAPDLNHLGGTDNDVYGWGLMSDSGFTWDGVYYDNSSDESNHSPEAMTVISGGLIRGSTGVLGIWNADSTRNKINSHQKTFFAYTTDYCNDGTNFSDGIARATSANFGTWTENSSRNPIQVWFNDSNRINLKLIEFAAFDGAYAVPSYESSTTLGRSVSQLNRLDSLAKANDFYVLFSGRINYQDTTVASGWSVMKDAFLRSNWIRVKSSMGHRSLFAAQPTIALTSGYFPCNSSGGTSYGGLIYTNCPDRDDVDQFITYHSLPFMREYDLGKKIADSSVTLTLTDGTAQTVSVYKTFWRDITGTDTTYSWMYYFPRSLSSWEWRPSGNHYVLINPPPPLFKRLEYDGTLTTISGDAQTCYIGNQLILSYTTSAEPYVESPMLPISGTTIRGVIIQ